MSTSMYFFLYVAFLLVVVQVQSLYLPLSKRGNEEWNKNTMNPRKRPFCNAFTGCGRKRSNIPPLQISRDMPNEEESISSLFELNAEPAVEDLSRQILSEAKLWEAIREANVELSRQKQYTLDEINSEEGTPAKSATATCALPPCII